MLKIVLDAKKGEFVSAEGSKFFRAQYVLGEGWTCRIRADGVIICKYMEERELKYYEICLKVNRKGVVTISRVKDGKKENDKRFRVKGWPRLATITLYGKCFEKANCFFM